LNDEAGSGIAVHGFYLNNQLKESQVSLDAVTFNFLQRVSIACYAERCISYDRFCLTDRPTV